MTKKVKSIACVLLLISVVVSLPINIFSFKPIINPIKASEDQVIINGKPMIYLRKAFERFGASVVWNKETNKILCVKGAVEAEFTVNSAEVLINNVSKVMDAEMILKGGKALVPLSFPWQNFNVKVTWNESKKSLSITKGPVVFFGDSITQGFLLKKYFASVDAINKGVSGNKTSDALKRINDVLSKKPDKVFIMLGTNDLWTNTDIEVTLENYNTIITKIRTACPYTDIVIESVMPFGEAATARNSIATNGAVDKLNARLQEMAKVCGLVYVDIGKHYKDSKGRLDKKYTYDGVHIINTSYNIWADCIRSMVPKL